MPAPAAPRKRGALTASIASTATAPPTTATRTRTLTRQTAPTINKATSDATTDDLAARLDRVALGATTASTGTAARKTGLVRGNAAAAVTKDAGSLVKVAAELPPLTDRESILATMKQINSIVSNLNASKKQGKEVNPKACYAEASIALDRLRAYTGELLDARKRLEIEKGALIFVGFLNEAGEFILAVKQLKASKIAVLKLYTSSVSAEDDDLLSASLANLSLTSIKPVKATARAPISTSKKPPAPIPTIQEISSLLNFPIAKEEEAIELFNHILLAQNHALTAAFGIPGHQDVYTAILASLTKEGGPLSVLGLAANRELVEAKKLDLAITAIFSTIMRKVSSSSASSLTEKSVNDHDVFSLKVYALECLLESRSYFEEKKGLEPGKRAEDVLAGHLHRATMVYCKALIASGTSEAELANRLEEQTLRLLAKVQMVIQPIDRLAASKPFVTYLDWLSQVARKGQNTLLLDGIASILASSPSPNEVQISESTEDMSELDAEQINTEVNRLCTHLSTETSKCEKWIKNNFQPAMFSTDSLRGHLQILAGSLQRHQAAALAEDTIKNMSRTMERLRYYVTRALRNADPPMPSEAAIILEGILSNLIEVVESCCSLDYIRADKYLIPGAIDNLLLLSRRAFVLDDLSSYRLPLVYLERAIALSDNLQNRDSQSPLVRCIASSAYNFGASLYNAERAANGIPFLQLACRVSDAAISCSRAQDSAELETNEDLKELKAQAPKRWELLGLSHLHIREKNEAAESFAHALSASIAESITVESVEKLEKDIAFGKILARYTKLSVFELLRKPEETSITGILDAQGHSTVNPEAKGRLLEMQINSVEHHLHKREAVEAISVWLKEAEALYRAAGEEGGLSPAARPARVLLRQMELSATITGYLTTGELANKGEKIVSLGVLDGNPASAQALNQYRAFAKIWIAFDAIRLKANGCSKVLAKEAKEALAILIEEVAVSIAPALASGITKSSSTKSIHAHVATSALAPKTAVMVQTARTYKRTLISTAVSQTAARKRTITTTVIKTTRKPLSPKNASKATANQNQHNNNIITPPRKIPKSPSAAGIAGSGSPKRSAAIDKARIGLEEPERALATLSALASVLGAFGHTFLRLSCLKLIRHLQEDTCDEEYVKVSTLLAYEYQQLGKWSRASAVFSKAEDVLANKGVSDTVRMMFLLRQADFLSVRGKHDKSLHDYMAALALSEKADAEEASSSTAQRIIDRSQLLLRTAVAAEVFSHIQFRKGHAAQALVAALQALRLANRAMVNLARITAANKPVPAETKNERPEIFKQHGPAASEDAPAQNVAKKSAEALAVTTGPADQSLGWDIAQILSDILLWTATIYTVRGSPRPAAYFLSQATELANDLGAPRLKAKIVTRQVDLNLHLQDSPAVQERLAVLTGLAGEDGGLSTIEVKRIRAHLSLHEGQFEEAETGFSGALSALQKLDKTYTATDSQLTSPQKHNPAPKPTHTPVKNTSTSDSILPSMQSHILHSHINLLCFADRHEDTQIFLQKLASLLLAGHDKSGEDALKAKVKLLAGLASLRRDPIMGLLHESVLSIPSLANMQNKVLSPLRKEALAFLSEVELLLLGAVSDGSNGTLTHNWKEICTSIASLRILQSSLGDGRQTSARQIASALEANTAITLRREMLESINSKLSHGILPNDLQWPQHSLKPAVAKGLSMSEYWQSLQLRYSSDLSSGSLSTDSISEMLPEEWAVLSLHLTADQQGLIAVRYEHGQQPFVLQLPLDRLGRREGEDHLLSFDLVKGEMLEIIKGSNDTSQKAKDIDTTEGRKAWWRERKDLEMRLSTLLVNMDQRWFGAFKNILTKPWRLRLNNAATQSFAVQLEQILRKAILTMKDSKNAQIKLDPTVMQCFYCLDKLTTDEELEDLFHFVLDSYQFCGVHIAPDEIDVDQAVVDIRSALDEYLLTLPETTISHNDHLFLVLDKALHPFPWESLPCLSGRSISRLPSLSFLQDRLELRYHVCKSSDYSGIVIDKKRTYYALNPGGDLKHTQKEFGGWLEQHGWDGIAGRKPMEEELRRALSSHDLFLYFGHGGAEQYIRSQTIRNLPKCATALLWGCSSGHLKEQGDFEETGIPWTYMIAGSPAVVANLWDVTDKDIDRFTKATLAKFGLDDQTNALSLPAAIATSRDSCTLRYLNGAAPVIWGIPVRLAAETALA